MSIITDNYEAIIGAIGAGIFFGLGKLRGQRVLAKKCPCVPAGGVTCIHGKMGGRDS